MDLLTRFNADPLPFAALLGIELVSVAPDRVVGRMTVRDALCTRPAIAHGGAIMAFADTLGAVATVANLPEGAGTTTIERYSSALMSPCRTSAKTDPPTRATPTNFATEVQFTEAKDHLLSSRNDRKKRETGPVRR